MAAFEHKVAIRRPIEDVFAFLHEPANDAKWQSSVAELRQSNDGLVGAGTTLSEVRHFLGKRIETAYELTEYDPPSRSSVKTTSGPVSLSGSYVLEAANGSTRFTMSFETDAHGFFKLAEPIFARFVSREMESNLGHLKDLLESGF